MPVPPDAIVCRFIRPQDWSRRDRRPKPGAFKQAGLSVWHQARLNERGCSLADLQVMHLVGCGQAHHTAGDYTQLARAVSDTTGQPFQVQVVWRPEAEFVAEPWRLWRYAHVQVETTQGPPQFPAEFRARLTLQTRLVLPPDP